MKSRNDKVAQYGVKGIALLVCVHTSVDGIQLGDLLPIPDMNFPDLEIRQVLDLYAAQCLENRAV